MTSSPQGRDRITRISTPDAPFTLVQGVLPPGPRRIAMATGPIARDSGNASAGLATSSMDPHSGMALALFLFLALSATGTVACAQRNLGSVVCVASELESLTGSGPVRRVIRRDTELVYRVGSRPVQPGRGGTGPQGGAGSSGGDLMRVVRARPEPRCGGKLQRGGAGGSDHRPGGSAVSEFRGRIGNDWEGSRTMGDDAERPFRDQL